MAKPIGITDVTYPTETTPLVGGVTPTVKPPESANAPAVADDATAPLPTPDEFTPAALPADTAGLAGGNSGSPSPSVQAPASTPMPEPQISAPGGAPITAPESQSSLGDPGASAGQGGQPQSSLGGGQPQTTPPPPQPSPGPTAFGTDVPFGLATSASAPSSTPDTFSYAGPPQASPPAPPAPSPGDNEIGGGWGGGLGNQGQFAANYTGDAQPQFNDPRWQGQHGTEANPAKPIVAV